MFATSIRSGHGSCTRWSAPLVLCAALVAASSFAGDITTGLVGHYKLDETGGTSAADSSGNNNTGVLQNFSPTPWVSGQVNGALKCDGVNDWVNVPDAPQLRMPGDFTVSFWLKKAYEPSGWRYIVGKGDWPNRNYTFWDFPDGDGRIHFSINDTAGGQLHTVDSVTSIVPGPWYHIVGVRSGGVTSLYINGVLDVTKVSPGAQPVSGAPLAFCATEFGSANHPGTVDEVRVYNRGLTLADVQTLYAFRDAPTVVKAIAPSATQVDLTFNAAITAASANTAANYAINDGVAVSAAVLQPDGRTVRLTTSTLQPQVLYTVSISNITNTLTPSLTIAPGYQRTFLFNESGLVTANLAAHYKLDETAGTVAADSSGFNNPGTLLNFNPPDWVDGRVNSALRFNGNKTAGSNSHMVANNIPVNTAASGTNTVAFWMRWDGGDTQMPFGWNTGFDLFLWAGGFGINTAESNQVGISSAGLQDRWVHVAVVFPNAPTTVLPANVTMYIDGVAQVVTNRQGTPTPAGRTATQTVYLAKWGADASTQYTFGGELDDVRIYSRTLTAAEAALLASGLPRVSVNVADANGAEPGSNTARFTLSRTGSTTAGLTVPITLTGTAAGTDYELRYAGGGPVATSPITIPAGAASVDLDVVPLDDSAGEPSETVILTVDPSLAAFDRVAPTSATVNIADDEAIITVLALQAAASERGPQRGAFLFTRSNNIVGAVTVSFTLSGTALSGTDYQALPLTVNLANGQTSATIFVDPLADSLVEGPETVVLTLNAGTGYYTVAPSSATVTIEDRSVVTLQASDPDAYEVGVNPGVITVTRTAPLDVALTVPYTVTGSAVAGTDYLALSGTVTFGIGASTAAITITPIDDALLGIDTIVTISIAGNNEYAAGTPAVASVTIHTDPEIFSGSGGMSMTPNPALAGQAVTFSGASGGAAVVGWQWSYGDGITGTGQQATHVYLNPGEYEISVSATLADGTVSTGKRLLFVGTAVDGAVPGAGAAMPGGGGLMLGGAGITKQAGGKLRIRFSRRQVTLSAKLGNLMFDNSLGQFSLQGRQGWLTIGPETNRRTYFFVLDAKGSGASAEVPKMQVSLKKRAISFTVVEPELTEFLSTLGASRTAPQTVINVPITVRVADKIFVAFTLVMDFKARNDNGAGTLRKQ